jgi:hypothetical protein
VSKGMPLDPGPRPPSCLACVPPNTAYHMTGPKAAFIVRKADLPGTNFRFSNDESITLQLGHGRGNELLSDK